MQVGKTQRREHKELLNIPAVTLPTTRILHVYRTNTKNRSKYTKKVFKLSFCILTTCVYTFYIFLELCKLQTLNFTSSIRKHFRTILRGTRISCHRPFRDTDRRIERRYNFAWRYFRCICKSHEDVYSKLRKRLTLIRMLNSTLWDRSTRVHRKVRFMYSDLLANAKDGYPASSIADSQPGPQVTKWLTPNPATERVSGIVD